MVQSITLSLYLLPRGNAGKHWYPKLWKGHMNKIGIVPALTLTEKEIISPDNYLLFFYFFIFYQWQTAFQRMLLHGHELVITILHLILKSEWTTTEGDYHLNWIRIFKKKEKKKEIQILIKPSTWPNPVIYKFFVWISKEHLKVLFWSEHMQSFLRTTFFHCIWIRSREKWTQVS